MQNSTIKCTANLNLVDKLTGFHDMIRLNKFLSEAGVCSRREADKLIESGRVTVDGKRAVPGQQVSEEHRVCVGKKVIHSKNEKVVLAVNKPVGVVCTEDSITVTQ